MILAALALVAATALLFAGIRWLALRHARRRSVDWLRVRDREVRR